MWDRFRRHQATEREQLRRLLGTIQPLLDQCRTAPPTAIELSALAALLHSFYTGMENIFKRVAVDLDAQPVRGERWHRELLDRMAQPGPRRPALLSSSLSVTMQDYLAFRHVFRTAYSFDLDWRKMSHLVLEADATFRKLEEALDAFLAAAE